LPIALHQEGLDDRISELLNIWSRPASLEEWTRIANGILNPSTQVTIAIVGKYVDLVDSYKSLHESLLHGGLTHETKVNFQYVDSENFESLEDAAKTLSDADGILIPGGFGHRGAEGKIFAVQYARENNVPFFGICLGLQIAVIEFARNVVGLKTATSQEFDEGAKDQVVAIMEDQLKVETKGGTMRLGAYPCKLKADTRAAELYKTDLVSERHRHRFEVNNDYRDQLSEAGLTISGTSPDDKLVEMVELSDHPHFVACQFHPEFKSKPTKPHPLFSGFVGAAKSRKSSSS
jgi:CTP synthase